MISFRSGITKKVLGYFFLHEGERLYINEMARCFDLDSGNLTRKLKELEGQGILKSELQGMERYFTLNRDFPLYKEYKSIVLKSVGIEEALRKALGRIPGLKEAFVFGSYASGQMDEHSDIDLLIVAEAGAVEVQKALSSVEQTSGRDINPVILSPEEYRRKRTSDPFIKTIEQGKKVRVI